MPNIKLRDGSGVEQTYTGVDTITVPLADGSGTWTFGLTDEDLTFEGGEYLCLFTNDNSTFEKYIDRIKIIPKKSTKGLYYSLKYFAKDSKTEDFSKIIIDCNGVKYFFGDYMFDSCLLKKTVTIINNQDTIIGNSRIFSNGAELITEDELLRFLSNFKSKTNGSSINSSNSNNYISIATRLYNVIDPSLYFLKLHQIINNEYSYHKYSSSENYEGVCLPYAKSHKNIPLHYMCGIPRTSNINIIRSYSDAMNFTDSFEFATDNGLAYKMNWKGQTIDLSGNVGCTGNSWDTYYTEYAQGYWLTKNNIFLDNNQILELTKERYNKLKGQDNWYSSGGSTATHDGKDVYLYLLFSRYNHDSMVATINSLPDTSEYLATAGGTNTIKFKKYMGDLTDGGGASNLTEQEIAVAAAKGWTVSIV